MKIIVDNNNNRPDPRVPIYEVLEKDLYIDTPEMRKARWTAYIVKMQEITRKERT